MPTEPPDTAWVFPPVQDADQDGRVAVGGDLKPGTLLAAYRHGLFPMPLGRRSRIAWWSPDPRGVLLLDGLHISRSLARSMRSFEIRINTSFESVMLACGDPSRPHGWINSEILTAYQRLHRLGWAHSVETWYEDELVGGLYGVCIGGLFAGESMFHHRTDASKAALVGLVEQMTLAGNQPENGLIDVQWLTPHLATLGIIEIPREEYLERSALARLAQIPDAFSFSG